MSPHYEHTDPRRQDTEDAQADVALYRELLAELFDGDCCDCNADLGAEHEPSCLQRRIVEALDR